MAPPDQLLRVSIALRRRVPGLQRLQRALVRPGLRDLRRTSPVSSVFGLDRGQPIDRYYIEQFLADHASDIRGRVLEIGDDHYTRRFGGDAVTASDVLHAETGNRRANLVGDLTRPEGIPANAFDCIILTQTLNFIYDVDAAVRGVYRALRREGVVLVTVAGLSQISEFDMRRWGDYWRFTTASVERLFGNVFGAGNVEVRSLGNVLAASAFLYGLAAEELAPHELEVHDPAYQVVIAARAVRTAWSGRRGTSIRAAGDAPASGRDEDSSTAPPTPMRRSADTPDI